MTSVRRDIDPARSPITTRARLYFVDGLRAVAALYVALTHAYRYALYPDDAALSPLVEASTRWLRYGHYAVDVFIVISGFCLMLPVVAAPARRLHDSIAAYVRRRARRILPPYYAALFLTLVLIALVPCMGRPAGGPWDVALPAFTPVALLSHLLLFHNLQPDWAYRINGALWSIGTEWQIYFLFPLLAALWRTCGIVATLVIGSAIGFGGHFALGGRIDSAAPWYVGLFAFGMVAAAVAFGDVGRSMPPRLRLPWGTMASLLAVGVFAAPAAPWSWMRQPWMVDTAVGAATACLLIYGTRDHLYGTEPAPMAIRPLIHPLSVAIGEFSYSIYLVHVPVIALMDFVIRAYLPDAAARLLIYLALSVMLSIGIAYPFHRLVERPFLSRS